MAPLEVPVAPSLAALLVYAAWTWLLSSVIVTLRSGLVVTAGRPPSSFQPDGADTGPFHMRLSRAHLNCVENLPVFASVVLVAVVSGHETITDGLAWVVVGARIAQSSVHLVSVRSRAVIVRATFFVVQLGILTLWIGQLLAVAWD